MVRKLEAGEGVSQGFYFTAHTCSAWRANPFARSYCGSAWKKDPGSGVIGVEKGPLIPVV